MSADAPRHLLPPVHLWGAPAAGKTGLLGALYATFKSREPDRWEAHPKDCRDAYTQEALLDAYEQLRDRNVAKTDVRRDGYRPLEFLLRQHRRGEPTGTGLRLSIVDPAGEYSTRAELGLTEDGRALFGRVARGGGLLWLFSAAPDASPDRLVVLRHLVALLEHAGGAQLSLPVGLCLSKVDALPPDEREAAIADPRAALLAQLGPTAFTWFEAACPRLRCFAISSAGVEPGQVRPLGLVPMLGWFAETMREAAPSPAPSPRAALRGWAAGAPGGAGAPPAAPAPGPVVVAEGAAAALDTTTAVAAADPGTMPTVAMPALDRAAVAAALAASEPSREVPPEPAAAWRVTPSNVTASRIALPSDALGDVPSDAPGDAVRLPLRERLRSFARRGVVEPVGTAGTDASRPAGATLAGQRVADPLTRFAPPPVLAESASVAPVSFESDDRIAPWMPDSASGSIDVASPDDASAEEPIAPPLARRVARAIGGALLVAAALAAGALFGRAAIQAAADRWQPPDAVQSSNGEIGLRRARPTPPPQKAPDYGRVVLPPAETLSALLPSDSLAMPADSLVFDPPAPPDTAFPPDTLARP